VCLLALATGLTLFAIGQSIAVSTLDPAPSTDAVAVDLARRFYAAANDVLRTGDATHLDPYVSSDMIDHAARAPGESGRTGLEAALLSRHTGFPGLRLVLDDARATGDIVVVRVHAERVVAGSFLGLTPSRDLAEWGPLDIVRVANGLIVERWGSKPNIARFERLWQSSISAATSGTPQTVALRSLTWAPGAVLEMAVNPAAWFLAVGTGSLTYTVAATPGGDGDGRTGTLAPGDLLVAPIWTGFRVQNVEDGPVRAFLVTYWPDVTPVYGREPTKQSWQSLSYDSGDQEAPPCRGRCGSS